MCTLFANLYMLSTWGSQMVYIWGSHIYFIFILSNVVGCMGTHLAVIFTLKNGRYARLIKNTWENRRPNKY